jgi:hypothetical protein
MEVGFVVSNARPSHKNMRDSKTHCSMIPTMGLCYMLQYMDKLALSQAVLLNLRKDLVSDTPHYTNLSNINTV